MPANDLTCPACFSILPRPSSLRDGETFECPMCTTAFRVATGESRFSSPLSPCDDRDEIVVEGLEIVGEMEAVPRKNKIKIRQRMGLTRLGLAFQYVKFLCTILAVAFMGISKGVTTLSPAQAHALSFGLGCLSIVALVVIPILGLTGSLLCLGTPKKKRSRLFIQISCGLDAGSLLLVFVGIILMAASVGGAPLMLFILGSLGFFASSILFLIFLRGLAFYLGDEVAAAEAMRIIFHWILAIVVPGIVFLFVVAVALVTHNFLMEMIVAAVRLIWIVVYVKVLLNLLNLISSVRQRIASRYNLD